MEKNLTVKKFFEVVGVILYLALLDIIYVMFIQSNLYYWGFDIDINYIKIIEAFILVLGMYFIIPQNQNKISSYIMKVQYIMIYIPLMSLYGLENNHRLYVYLVTSIFIIMFISLNRNIEINIKKTKLKEKHLIGLLYIIIVITIFNLLRHGMYPSLDAFKFENVYVIRNSIYLDSLTGYLIGITTRIIIPFLICINIINKNYKNTLFIIFIQLVIYSIYPLKSILFSSVLVISVIYMLKQKNFFLNLIYIFIGICIISIISKMLLDNDFIIETIIRRVLFVPVNIQFDYYDFFSNNEYLYMSNNLIGSILNIDYKYNMPIVNLIASIYYGQPKMAANTCYVAESYAQLGYLGMLIYSSIFIWICRILDSINKKLSKYVIIPTIIYSLYALNDASLLTTLLTHGLVPGIIILYMYTGGYKKVK